MAEGRRRFVVLGAIAVAALAALGVALAVSLGGGGEDAVEFRGASSEPPRPAPRTTGEAADGRPIAFPREGRPAAVTFLFANCPDVCPLVADRLSSALDRLGGEAEGLDVVVVSVDPEGDTPRAVRTFLDDHDLAGRARWMIGSHEELEPVWSDWLVTAQPPGNEDVSIHSAPVVLVDERGRRVGRYSGAMPIDPADLAADLRSLL